MVVQLVDLRVAWMVGLLVHTLVGCLAFQRVEHSVVRMAVW